MVALAELQGVGSPPALIHAIESHLVGCFGATGSTDPILGDLPEFNATFPRARDRPTLRVVHGPDPTIPKWWWVASGARATERTSPPESFGYALHHRERGMAVGIRTAHQRTLMPRGSLVHAVKTPEDRQWVVDLWTRARPVGNPTAAADLAEWLAAAALREPESRRVLLAWSGGRPVATVATRRSDDVVGVYGLCVLPEMRHAGLGRALLAAALRRSEYDGANWAVTIARVEDEPFYVDFGFAPYCDFDVYRREAAPAGSISAPV